MAVARRLLFLILVGTMVIAPLGSVRAVPGVQTESSAAAANGSAADFFDRADDSSSSTVCLGQCGSTSACAVMTGQQALPIPLAGGAEPVSYYLIPVGSLPPPDSQPPKALLNV